MQTNNKLRETLVAVKKSIDEIGASSLDGNPEILMMSLTQVCARLSARIDAALSAPATTEKSSAVGDAAKLREAQSERTRNAQAWAAQRPANLPPLRRRVREEYALLPRLLARDQGLFSPIGRRAGSAEIPKTTGRTHTG